MSGRYAADPQQETDIVDMLIEVIMIGFGVALAVFVITRLNSGLSRAERKRLTSTSSGA